MHSHSFNMYLSSSYGPGPGLALRAQWRLWTWLKSLRVEIQKFLIHPTGTDTCFHYLLWLWIQWLLVLVPWHRKLPFFVPFSFLLTLLLHSSLLPCFCPGLCPRLRPLLPLPESLGDYQDRWPLKTRVRPTWDESQLHFLVGTNLTLSFLLCKTEIITSTLFKWLN